MSGGVEGVYNKESMNWNVRGRETRKKRGIEYVRE